MKKNILVFCTFFFTFFISACQNHQTNQSEPLSPLIIAIAAGNFEDVLKHTHQKGAGKVYGKDGHNPLHILLLCNKKNGTYDEHCPIAETLLVNGAWCLQENQQGITPFELAVTTEQKKIARTMLKYDKHSIQHYFCTKDPTRYQAVQQFLMQELLPQMKSGTSYTYLDPVDIPSLSILLYNQDYKKAEEYITEFAQDINTTEYIDDAQMPLVAYFLYLDKYPQAQWLKEHGADLDKQIFLINEAPERPVFHFLRTEQFKQVWWLIQKGADIVSGTPFIEIEGWQPFLHLALLNGQGHISDKAIEKYPELLDQKIIFKNGTKQSLLLSFLQQSYFAQADWIVKRNPSALQEQLETEQGQRIGLHGAFLEPFLFPQLNWLLKKDIDVSDKILFYDLARYPFLFLLLERNHYLQAKKIVTKNPELLNETIDYPSGEKDSLLFYFLCHSEYSPALWLLKQGADPLQGTTLPCGMKVSTIELLCQMECHREAQWLKKQINKED